MGLSQLEVNYKDQARRPAAIVLCGGKSSRLGRDKASEIVGGRTLVERVVHSLAQVAGEIILVQAPDQPDYSLTIPVKFVRDSQPDLGPLMGLDAGLRAVRSAYLWAVACDMPFLDPIRLGELMQCAAGFDAVVPRVAGRLQPLHGVYSDACAPIVEELLNEPGSSLHDLLHRVRTRVLDESEGGGRDAWLRSCFNVNSANDLRHARRMERAVKSD
jgi:molybdopterin-guanine dinucleotide biosynthesis protein A